MTEVYSFNHKKTNNIEKPDLKLESNIRIISKLKSYEINNYYKRYNCLLEFNQNDEFTTYCYNFEGGNIVPMNTYEYKKETPIFYITICETCFQCEFPDLNLLSFKIDLIPKRYISYELDLYSPLANASHSVLLVFDKFSKTSFVIDSSTYLCYFDNISITEKPISSHLESFLEKFSDFIGFTFISAKKYDIDRNINKRGICRSWTLFMNSILTNAEPNFEFISWYIDFTIDEEFANQQLDNFINTFDFVIDV